MSQTPSYYFNNPAQSTTLRAPMGYGCIPNNATGVTVTAKAWSGANGTGSLVAVTSLHAIVSNFTTGIDYDQSGSGVNTETSLHTATNSTDWYRAKTYYTNGSNVGSIEVYITYTGTAFLPSISSFSPGAGGQGTSVVITGSHFTDCNSVDFNGTPAASFSIDSDTQITAVVPAGALTGRIHVVNGNGTATSPSDFTVAQCYVNTGTPTSPVWTPGLAQVNTGTPASPVWTAASLVAANTGTPASPVWTPGA